uniref:BHLH domain-containing protein n=1 Tax=Echeneis naucrates TaxID=173247 RepID=A0A665V212_ECHNA
VDGEVTTTASRDPGSVHRTQPAKAAKAASDSARGSQNNTRKRARSSMSHSERRERHNTKERERRKRIRLCCDELNMLVPFCDSDTDKATTLQWTTAFLRYINKTYGDAFKEVCLQGAENIELCKTFSLHHPASKLFGLEDEISITLPIVEL